MNTQLTPAVIQDNISLKVLMLGYMNEEALAKTKSSGLVTFYSRSKQRLWTKGETSGNYLKYIRNDWDCDSDALLIQATPIGPTCHNNTTSCFDGPLDKLLQLQDIIIKRQNQLPNDSYTTELFQKGLAYMAQKVGEEATEVVVAALAQDDDQLISESADLLYHLT